MNDLKQTLQNNPKGRMILMLAVADQCKKVIDVSFRDEFINTIATCAASMKFSLTDEDKEMFSQAISDGLKKVSNDMDNASLSVDDKILALGAAMEQEMTHECRTALESILEVSEIAVVDGISAMDAAQLVLWMVVSQVLEEYSLCKQTLKEASSYKRASKEPPVQESITKESGTTDNVLTAIHNRKYVDIDGELPDKVHEVISAMTEYLKHECTTVKESIANGDNVTEKSVIVKAVSLKKKLSFSTEHMLSLLKDHIASGGTLDVTSAGASVLYSEIIYAVVKFLPNIVNQEDFIMKVLELPETFLILTEYSLDKIDLTKAAEELITISQIGEVMSEDPTIRKFIETFKRCTTFFQPKEVVVG